MKMPAPRNLSLAEKLDFYSIPEPNSGCTLWLGASHSPRGYGAVGHDGKKNIKPHRAAYELAHGSIPAGMHVLHKCDNSYCINPDHLFAGSHDDNMADMVAKGRSKHGEALPQTKLTSDQVYEIRRSAESSRDAARIYGVHPTTIKAIRRRHLWAHLPEEGVPCR